MIKRTLKQVQEMVSGWGLATQFEADFIEGVQIDSRAIEPGNLYIPIIGARVDGHTFASGAFQNGAGAVLWQDGIASAPSDMPVIFVKDTETALQALATAYRNELDFKIIGITGSNGKTSTKDILSSILAAKFQVHKTAGNFNSEFGMPLTLLRAPENTEVCVLEMGMRGLGQISLLSHIARPDAAIITNIGEAHIEELGSRENISIAKFEITDGLTEQGIFVYPGEEPLLKDKAATLDKELITFGESPENDYYPLSLGIEATGMVFRLKGAPKPIQLPILGKHNVMNTLAAIAVARHFGMDFHEIQTGLSSLEMSKMRMEISKLESGLTLINDAYNSSPTSVKATLDLLNSLTGYGKKIVVLADMLELGENAAAYHTEVGAAIDPAKIQAVFTFGPLANAYLAAASKVGDTRTFEDKAELAQALQELSTSGDIALIKGSRGMKLEDILAVLH